MLRTFKLIVPFLISLLFNTERGWTHPQTGWEVITSESMCFYFINSAYLDNFDLEEGQNDVIGVFFNNQNIGWEFYSEDLTLIPTSGDDGSLPGYPQEGDNVTFKIYDASEDAIIDATSLNDFVPFEVHGFIVIMNLYACSSDFPILEDGTCIVNCMGDINLDGEVNLLDLIEIINLIINCGNNEDCFPVLFECVDYNGDDVIDILDIILIINTIL